MTTTAEVPRASKKRPQYFNDPAIDKLAAVVVELAAQVWVMKDRARIIEGMLERGERVTAEAIDHFEPSDEEQQSLRKERDDFISRLFREITTDLA